MIGADGLHSQVRRLVFGEQARFERYLGLKVAACSVLGYRPRDELVYVTHTDVGQQVGRFAMRDDRTMLLFIFSDRTPDIPEDLAGQKARLRERFWVRVGSAPTSSLRLNAWRVPISIASARSAWIDGRKDASRWSVTPHLASLSWVGRVRHSR